MEPCQMFDDPREISHLTDYVNCFDVANVGSHGVTKIVCYKENGECAHLPYFAIYKGEYISSRHPATNISVYYKDAEQ